MERIITPAQQRLLESCWETVIQHTFFQYKNKNDVKVFIENLSLEESVDVLTIEKKKSTTKTIDWLLYTGYKLE